MSDYCIVVDGYSTGKTIARRLVQEGIICLHVKSSTHLPKEFQHNLADYHQSFDYQGGSLDVFAQSIYSIIGQGVIRFIVAGSESGIELADRLNQQFGLPGNNPEKSHLRRNKFLMNEVARIGGVKTVEQCRATQAGDIIQWANVLPESAWPIVLKPMSSQSADHVFFCHDQQEIDTAFHRIAQTSDMFGQINQEVLAQSYNDGQEYIVNTVSHDRRHWVAEIWKINKRPQTTIYEYAELIDSSAPEFEPLKIATFTMLDLVGTRYGAGTTEFKYTPNKGPVLLETTSRPMGGAPLDFSQAMLGYTQVSVMLEALLKPEQFLARLTTPPLVLNKHGIVVVLIANAAGALQQSIEHAFNELATCVGAKLCGKKGDLINVTIDSLSSPGEVYLIGVPEAIQTDYIRIRTMEIELYRRAMMPPAMYIEPLSSLGLLPGVGGNALDRPPLLTHDQCSLTTK